MRNWATLLTVLLLVGCRGFAPIPEQVLPQDLVTSTVERIVDGDTFVATELAEPVRLWGIDAPDRHDGAAGQNATDWLRSVARDANDRFLCEERDRDAHGRIVARCFTPEGRDIGAAMIEAGHAVEWCGFSGGAYGQCGWRGGRRRDRRGRATTRYTLHS